MQKSDFIYTASVKRVIDGDTVDLLVDLGFGVSLDARFRLVGINTPEKNSKVEEEKHRAFAAFEYLEAAVNGKQVTIRTVKDKDKYGRYLAEIFLDGVNLNKSLVEQGLAVPYDGGKR